MGLPAMKLIRQRGQAMTEFILYGAFIFIPIFLLLPALAKYTELQQKAEEASRYAVWERTVWSDAAGGWNEGESHKTDNQISAELNNRIFGHPLQGFNANTGQHPFWKDKAGQPMVNSVKLTQLKEYNEPAARLSALGGVEQVAYLGGGIYSAARALTLNSLKPYGLGLGSRNYVETTVQIDTKNITTEWVPGPASFTIEANAGIFSNSWAANTRRSFNNRIDNIVANEVVQLLQFPANILCGLSIGDVPYGEGCDANPVNAQADWRVLPPERLPR